MILETDFLTLLLVLLFAAASAYKISYFKNKNIGYFSLLQVIYLVIVPGFAFTFAFSYLQSILKRPLNNPIILNDSFLVNAILISILFTYGGMAIHAVTKMLHETIGTGNIKAFKMNSFFHLTFSHNLIYSGAILTATFLTLLELNHVAPEGENSLIWASLKGITLGLSLLLCMFWYNPYHKMSKWNDLKIFFLFFWFGIVTIFYSIKKVNPAIRNYDLLLPILLSYSLIGLLSTFLILRKLKRGGFRLYLRIGKIKQKLLEV